MDLPVKSEKAPNKIMKIFNKFISIILLLFLAGCERAGNDSIGLVRQGVKCVEAGQYDKAIGLYKKAIELHPESDGAYLQMALLYDEYLGDKTNAISAYRKYLKISKNEINKEKVRKWIKEATIYINNPKTQFSVGNAIAQNNNNDSVLREKQFDAVRRQLIDKYESKTDVLKDELFNVKNQCAKLSNENIALRSDEKNKQLAGMLNTIASNEIFIATLQTQIEADKREAYAALQAQKTFQTIITNLQASLSLVSGNKYNLNGLIKSNAFFLTRTDELQNEIKDIKQEKTLLRMQVAELKKKYARKYADNGNRPTVELTPELLQAFEDAKKELFELKRRERFNRQEREKFIKTISVLRKQLLNNNSNLKNAQKNIEKNTGVIAEVKQLKSELDRERTSLKYREKQLFDRTLQLKKMQQSYSNLKRQYVAELQKQKGSNPAVNNIQKNITGNGPAATKGNRIYTVVSGDSLSKIAKKVYGDEKKYKTIYQANRKTLKKAKTIYQANRKTLKKANKLKVGQVLIIP